MEQCDIAIIGAGAAGLACAIFAGERAHELNVSPRIVLLDGATKIGAKILVAGGGRCNVTHDVVTTEDYFANPNHVKRVLGRFSADDAKAWFARLGVKLKREETGKLFPTTDRARTVLDALVNRVKELAVELHTGCRVEKVEHESVEADDDNPGMFVIHHSRGQLLARQLVLATGGQSLPRTGSDGQGYRLAKSLGHTITQTYPALVALRLRDGFMHTHLSGISHSAQLTTFAAGKRIDQRTGSLLWTHFGISGPVAMDASRHWVIAKAEKREPSLRANFLIDPSGQAMSCEQVDAWLVKEAAAQPRQTLVKLLSPRLPARVAEALIHHAGSQPDMPLNQLSREARKQLVRTLTELDLPVTKPRGWNDAEVTAGGVPLSEINIKTLASRCCTGLYLAGEILDCDGRIGGFNFQWAWATGYIAGHSVIEHQR